MRNRYLILIIGIFIGFILSYAAFDNLRKPQDPEVITVQIPAPPPFEVVVEIPVPVYVDSSSIFDMALASIDTSYIQSLVEVDSNAIINLALSKVDTAAILRNYFATYHYEQNITDDTLFNLELGQSISQNKIINQSVIFSLLKNEVKYVPVKTKNIYAGGMLLFSDFTKEQTGSESYLQFPRSGIATTINYANQKGNYGLGYDPFNKTFIFQAQIRLFSWH